MDIHFKDGQVHISLDEEEYNLHHRMIIMWYYYYKSSVSEATDKYIQSTSEYIKIYKPLMKWDSKNYPKGKFSRYRASCTRRCVSSKIPNSIDTTVFQPDLGLEQP